MRTLFSILGAGAIALSGCNQAKTTAPSTNPAQPEQARRLTVTSPGEQNVTRNETNKFTVRVDRDNFAGPIEVEIKNLPKGVSVVTPELTIPTGKDSVEVAVKAMPDAAIVNDHKVQIVARAKDQKDMKEAVVLFDMDVKGE